MATAYQKTLHGQTTLNVVAGKVAGVRCEWTLREQWNKSIGPVIAMYAIADYPAPSATVVDNVASHTYQEHIITLIILIEFHCITNSNSNTFIHSLIQAGDNNILCNKPKGKGNTKAI